VKIYNRQLLSDAGFATAIYVEWADCRAIKVDEWWGIKKSWYVEAAPSSQWVGASQLVPKGRPIDGIDVAAFMLDKSETTGRDSYMFFGADGELMSIMWKI
jgi:hypothetical protein